MNLLKLLALSALIYIISKTNIINEEIKSLYYPKITKIFTIIGAFILVLTLMDGKHFGIEKKDDTNFIDRIINRIYFAMVTSSTVGYGDYSPTTPIAKLIVSVFLMFMIAGILS